MPNLNAMRTFETNEDGALTFLNLYLLIGMLIFGGLGIDLAYAYKSRTELQVAADAAAHAAIYTRELGSVEAARAAALDVATEALSSNAFGEVLQPGDIQFGTWNASTKVFSVDNNRKDAVMVNTARYASRGNSVPTFFLSLIGFNEWDVETGAVYETYMPTCFREGFVAEDVVDVQSNNTFTNGFCIHSNTHVKFSSNNWFDDDTIVSMPDLAQIELPASGYETNDGLQEALTEGRYNIRILNRLEDIIDGLKYGDTNYLPDYIYNTFPLTLASNKVDADDFTPNRIHTYTCNGGKSLQIEQGTILSEVVIVTNCKIKFGSNVVLENVVVATTSTDTKSVTAASGLQVGRDDNCAPDGGSQILTMGGIDIPADLKVYGGQLIAMDDIEFAANANGIEGASFISGAHISGTSNMTMGFCGTGWERNFEAKYFHLRA